MIYGDKIGTAQGNFGMRWMAVAAFALVLGGWSSAASATPTCGGLFHDADSARLTANGGFTAFFQKREEPKTDKEKTQRLFEVSDAALKNNAALAACGGTEAEDIARIKQMKAWQPDQTKAVSAALAQGTANCLGVLAAVDNVLNQSGRALQAGGSDPKMIYLIDAALVLNTEATPACRAAHGANIASFVQQGAEQRRIFGLIARCTPSQEKFQNALATINYVITPTSTRAEYDSYITSNYEPAVKALKTDCAPFTAMLDELPALDARMRSYDKLKAEAVSNAHKSKSGP